MKHILFLFFALALAATARAAAPLELKGLRLGMSAAEVDALHAVLHCSAAEQEEGVARCDFDPRTVSFHTELDKLGGFYVGGWELRFLHGKLGQVTATLLENHSEELAAELQEKYGKPKDSPVPVQNLFGAVFVDHFLEWSRGGESLYVLTSGLGDYSAVTLSSRAWAEHHRRAERAKRRAKAKDL